MPGAERRYRYVGPPEIAAAVGSNPGSHPVRSTDDLDRWWASVEPHDRDEPFTFVVALDGVLRLAPRRSEHVACAGAGDVLAAGEIGFDRQPDGWTVREVSNQSTGYCPDPDCWPAVAAALVRAGLCAPEAFTSSFVFRRCPDCHERVLVRDGDLTCVLCGSALPARWNLDSVEPPHQPER